MTKWYILFCLVMLTGCKKSDQDIRIDLQRIVSKEVSALKKELRPALDSLCALQQSRFVRQATDSMVSQRKKIIREIIRK